MKAIDKKQTSVAAGPSTRYSSSWLYRAMGGTVALAAILFFSQMAIAQTITNLYVSDSTFVVPAGVTTITVEAWGGGGRGGSRSSGSGATGGGGGGAYSRSVLTVTPGQTNTIKIGVGAISNSSPGGDSWFSTNAVQSGAVVLATGGQTVANSSSSGASGGNASSGIGDVRYSGGNGANGSGSNAGGGGSSAGVSANGSNGSGSTGGIAPAEGGNGGNGRSGSQGNGYAGAVPGGGGGGAYRSSSGTRTGGNGANGRVRVTYVRQPAKIVFLTPPRVMIANTVSASITVQLRDAGNNVAQSIGDTVINLSSSESGTFRDQSDNYDITSITVSNEQNSATFVYRSGVIGTHVLTATDAASVLTQNSQNLIVKDVSSQPAPVQIFYMPVPEAQMLTMFNVLHSTPQNPVYRYAGITVSATNTLIYYDQMEDGYEAQIHDPASIYDEFSNPSGTQIWGDGDLSNGVAPGFPNDIIPPGSAIILSNAVNTASPPSAANPKFNGGDRIGTTKAAALTYAMWASDSQTLMAHSCEVYDTYSWGVDYRVPVGTDIDASLQSNVFEYVGASIMAGRGGATVQIDTDANGTFETTINLAEGQAHLINNGLKVGAHIVASKPVQVDLLTGDIGANYEMRGFRLLPTALWASSYYTAVSTPPQSFITGAPASGTQTAVWLYNPGSNTLAITYDRRGGANMINNLSNKGTNYASQIMTGSGYGNIYGQIAELNNDGTYTGSTPEGAWIGIVNRSGTAYGTVVTNAMKAGVAALIYVNNTGGNTYPSGSANAIVPVVGMTQNGGAALRAGGLGIGWVRVSGDSVTSTINVPAGGYARQIVTDGYGGHFYAANEAPFYAISTTDVTGTSGANQAWDWGYTLVPETSLTRQVLVGLGFGRDPTSNVNPNENGSPVWVTTVGNGSSNVTVYVDFDADPTTGAHVDVYGSRYDLALTMRELELVKIYNPSGNQSGLLAYVLERGVKLAAAWGQDPMQSTTGEPGFDAGTGIPPLPLFTAAKKSMFARDNDGDGFISPGDGIDYEIRILNISRVPVDDLIVKDVLPSAVFYLTNTTTFVDHYGITSAIPDHVHGFPLDDDGTTLPEPSLPPAQQWLVRYSTQIKPFHDIPTGTVSLINYATVNSLSLDDPVQLDTEQPIYGRIGDRVWHDPNGNGIQDAGENGIAGVTVHLYDEYDALLGTRMSDSNGFYVFTGLTGGNYRVEFVLTNNFVFAPQNADGEGLRGPDNSDADVVTGRTELIHLEPGEPLLAVDAGLCKLGEIGDYVWFDRNGNGLQDVGESGVAGVTLRLLDSSGNQAYDFDNDPFITTSDNNGAYRFTGVHPGEYRLEATLPSGYTFTFPDADSQGYNGPDNSDVAAGTGVSPVILLTCSQVNLKIDVGLTRLLATIGDRVWLDENNDGEQDAGEDGIPNVVVELLNAADEVVATTVTDTEGNYLFKNLSPGNYSVRVATNSLPAGLVRYPTFDEDGTNTAHVSSLILGAGTTHLTADFGYSWVPGENTGVGAIGDRVWVDANGDGVQDPGEPGIAGVSVTLYSDDNGDGIYDHEAASTVTDGAGNYIFTNLPAGAYVVVVNGGNSLSGYTQTGDPDYFGQILPNGKDDNRTTVPIVLAPGDLFVNADFGFQPESNTAGFIGDRIWFDANADGVQDNDETGIIGVTVALVRDTNGDGVWDAGEPIIAMTATTTNGLYLFTGLQATDGVGTDDYLVWVNDTAAQLAYLSPTYDLDGVAPSNGIVVGYGISVVADLTPAGTLLYDFGYTADGHEPLKGLIGDYVWLDLNGDGVQDANEQGLGGVIVSLFEADGVSLIASTVTDNNGYYWFGDLGGGTYVVGVDTNTLPNGGIGMVNSGDPDGGADSRSSVTITNSEINLVQDFGYHTPTLANAVGGTIWEDRNSDGLLAGAETSLGIAGVTVVLYDDEGRVVGTTVTDTNGDYLFTGLPDGTYLIDVTDSANVLNGWWHSYGPNPGQDNNSQTDPYSVTVTGGQTNTTGDFGYYLQPAAIGDFVWHDVNGNGIQEIGENGIANAKLILTITYHDSTVINVVTYTDNNGNYAFRNLLLDEDYNGYGANEPVFEVAVETPNGWLRTVVDAGNDDTLDSDNHASVVASAVRGTFNTTYDFGFFTLARLYGYTYWDKDLDLTRNQGDTPVVAMAVQLWLGETQIASTNTDEIGFYEFNNLVPGTYEVRFICNTNSLTAVAGSEPALSDPERNRAVAIERDVAHALYSITSGHGIGANVGEPVNAGFKGDGPMSSDIDLRAFVAEDGVYVEFLAYDVEQDGTMILYVLGPNNEVIAQYEVDVNQSDRQLVRFKILENLKAGGAYNFALRDEVGQYWSANGVLVGTLSTKAIKMTRQGISLTVNTLPGREYTVRWTSRLGLPWQNVTNFTALGEHTTLVVTPPVANSTSGFFEVTEK